MKRTALAMFLLASVTCAPAAFARKKNNDAARTPRQAQKSVKRSDSTLGDAQMELTRQQVNATARLHSMRTY